MFKLVYNILFQICGRIDRHYLIIPNSPPISKHSLNELLPIKSLLTKPVRYWLLLLKVIIIILYASVLLRAILNVTFLKNTTEKNLTSFLSWVLTGGSCLALHNVLLKLFMDFVSPF